MDVIVKLYDAEGRSVDDVEVSERLSMHRAVEMLIARNTLQIGGKIAFEEAAT